MTALLFDFNGTPSDHEGLPCAIIRELYAEQGRPLSEQEYFDALAGLSDPAIVERWLGPGHPATAEVLERRVQLFRERAGDGSTVPLHVREAVLRAAGRSPLAVVSGATRSEVELVLRAAGLDLFDVIVSAEDVTRGKPGSGGLPSRPAAPATGSRRGRARLPPGIAAAKAAGLGCVAVLGTVPRERLGQADEIVPRLDAGLVDRLLSP